MLLCFGALLFIKYRLVTSLSIVLLLWARARARAGARYILNLLYGRMWLINIIIEVNKEIWDCSH